MPPKRKKRFHGLYYHSSPPRVLPMNGQGSSETKKKSADDFSVRLSTIRIWMHEKDIGKLTRVLWAGQGNRLRQQASTNPRVKRFLAAVPYVMNTIKDVHQSVVDNSLETLQATMEPPVPPSLITSKDLNGLNVIHKAAGLGHTMILEYLLGIWPDGAHETDMTGKTPLHWAASAKNNMRCYTLLTQAGCEEDALDYKMKTPAYYKQKHNEIERSFLTLVPEAPRVSQDIPTDWDALASDDSDERKKPEIKIPNGRRKSDIIGNGMNLLTSRSEANSIENTSEPDLFEGDKSTEEASEAQPPEPVVNGNEEETPPEDAHLEDGDGVGDDLEPPSPPKTPDEKPEERLHEDEEKVTDEPPPPTPLQQEDGNVSIALSDHNNDDTNESKEDAEDGDDKDNDANGESNKNDKSEEEGGNVEEVESGEDQTEGDVHTGENDDDTKSDLGEEEKENNKNLDEGEIQGEVENEDDRQNDEDTTSKVDGSIENEKMVEQDVEEKHDETQSVKDNDEHENSEDTEENKIDSEVRDEEATEEEIDHTSETEQENETESTPLEDSQPVEDEDTEDTENIERPKTQNEQNEVSPQTPATETESDIERDAENVESKINEPQQPQKEADDDDDAQDAGKETLADPPTPTETEPEMDENENIPEFDDKMATDSPTSSLAIEGYVLGDSEDNQVQSESAAILDDEEKYVKAIIDAGDMEQLAALVLNGDGKKILNKTSSQPEIQAFLNNVPAYMSKISRVHEAARQGTLYQLQSALDRRKFAIAKDAMSPCGASPLHVAVLFGHADIVRYLAGRFPETTSAVDDDGRTPLHYAATIKDNGHFFNLLSHLGGNPRAVDKLGHTADFYTNAEEAKDILTYKILLQRFGAETLEDEMLSDQGKTENYTQNAIFKTEQGRYLASCLGDPLIKGLTEIAEKRPSDPVAYLAGFLQNYMRSRKGNRDNDTGDTNSTALVNSDPEIPKSPPKVNGIDAGLVEERFSSPETTPKNEDRDEHGQSMLHFACARSHRRNGLLSLIEESQIDVTYRDELYRTARDVSLQANQPGNAKEIDRYVLSLAVVGDTKPFESMAIAGYDHILDVIDDDGVSIVEVAETRGHAKLVEFLNDLRNLEEMREELHQAIRDGDFEKVKEITSTPDGKWLIKAKNYYGRTAMHIAVLKELEEMVEYFVNTCPDALKCGDNLERTPLHYAMGTNAVEGVSRILIRKGAKRTIKDLKGRQPSYYFINKADIMRLQEEEDENH